MKDRLITLIQNSVNGCAKHWAEIIADYLLANGVIVPPCNLGDTVYEVITCKNKANNRIDGHIRSCIATSIHLSKRCSKKDEPYITLGADGHYLHGGYIKRVSLEAFGETIFLTQEEAERALKERTAVENE